MEFVVVESRSTHCDRVKCYSTEQISTKDSGKCVN
jgi:hypothetical protein